MCVSRRERQGSPADECLFTWESSAEHGHVAPARRVTGEDNAPHLPLRLGNYQYPQTEPKDTNTNRADCARLQTSEMITSRKRSGWRFYPIRCAYKSEGTPLTLTCDRARALRNEQQRQALDRQKGLSALTASSRSSSLSAA